MKYFVISDVHSSYDAMIKALNEVKYDANNKNHLLIFLGDAFDKGTQHVETFLFFRDLVKNNKMIWIRGNHESEFISVIKNKKYTNDCKEAPLAISKYFNKDITNETDIEIVTKTLIDNGVLDLLENTVNYFELDKYIFTHGCIPTTKNNEYDPNWKDPSINWEIFKIRKANGVRMVMINKLNIPGKTLVCGHTGAYFGNLIKDHPDLEFGSKEFNRLKVKYSKDFSKYHTYFGDKVINLDANAYKTGFVNVLVIEEVGKNNGK